MASSRWLSLAAVGALCAGSCDSSSTSTALDPALQAQITALSDCLPNLWQFADGLLDIASSWQVTGDNNPPDPAELSWSFSGQDINASLTVAGSTIQMTISAYGPNGAAEQRNCQTLSNAGPISPVTSLSEAIDNIATQLRNEFNTSNPFLHGVWQITGGGISASNEGLLGIIGGATNANELEEVRTTVDTVTTGVPANDPSTITDSGGCTFTFDTTGLITDEEPGQEYPRGVINLTVNDGTTNVTGTITFDKTAVAVIAINSSPVISASFNLETRDITFNPSTP